MQAYDERQQRVSDRLQLQSLWYGLDYGHQLVVASDGNHGVWVVRFKTGRFSKPRQLDLAGCELPAALVLENRSVAVVACNRSHEVVRFDIRNGRILARAPVGEFPYAVKRLADGRMAVSNWGQASVSILDGSSLRVAASIPVGSQPSDMLELPERNELLVACSDSDLVVVLDLEHLREVRRVNIQIPNSSLGGAQPDALASDPDTGRLFVALAAVNAVAVFDLARDEDATMAFQGLLPVGAYPVALLHSARARTLWIADGRNATAGPSSFRRKPKASARRPRDTATTATRGLGSHRISTKASRPAPSTRPIPVRGFATSALCSAAVSRRLRTRILEVSSRGC